MVKSSKKSMKMKMRTRKHCGGANGNNEQQTKSTVEHLQENLKNATGKAKEKMQQLLNYLMGLLKSVQNKEEVGVKNVMKKEEMIKPKQESQQQVGASITEEEMRKRVNDILMPKRFQQKGGKKTKSVKKRKNKTRKYRK